MPYNRMLPLLWIRLVAVLAFLAFMIHQKVAIVAVVAGILLAVTIVQIVFAYRNRD